MSFVLKNDPAFTIKLRCKIKVFNPDSNQGIFEQVGGWWWVSSRIFS
jgi:hypothetical protein